MGRTRLFAVVLTGLLTGCGVDSELTLAEGGEDTEEVGAELGANAASAWFPMAEGDEWVLASPAGSRTVEVVAAAGAGRFVTGLASEGGQWLGASTPNSTTLNVLSSDTGVWGPFVRFGYVVKSWRYAPTGGACDQFIARRSATGVRVTTPAGTFENARSVSFELQAPPNVRCAAPFFRELTFVAGVGPVSMVSGAGEVFLLKSAKVGLRRFPASVTARVSTDQAVYRSQSNTIRCITFPCPSNEVTAKAWFALTVTNATASPRTFAFNSGKQFDFEVLDASGKVVRAWSDGRYFTLALTQLTPGAGQSRTFHGEVELKDRDGAQLSGAYQVRGFLTSANGPSAVGSFRVDVQ